MNYTEMQVKSILGEELYNTCYEFFQEMYERKSEFKIIMTRRCFSLYKIFKPILLNNGVKNEYGKIITDKSLNLYLDDILNSLKNETNQNETVVTVFDDIIIYGRTISTLLDSMLGDFLSDANTDQDLYINKVLVRCMVQSKYVPKVKDIYRKRIITDAYGSRKSWKIFSTQFSSLVKFCDVANTSYIISYKQTVTDDEKLSLSCTCSNELIERSNDELKKLNIEYYITQLLTNPDYNFLSEFIETCWIRIYLYKEMNVIQFSPLVILKELTYEQVDIISKYLIKRWYLDSKSKVCVLLTSLDEKHFSSKIQLITLLLSHILLSQYLLSNTLVKFKYFDYDSFDIDDIISYNFSQQMIQEIYSITSKCFESNTYEYLISKREEIEIGSNADFELFNSVLFEKAMRDNKAAMEGINERTDGFSKINSKSVFSNKFMPAVLSSIDQGKASLNTLYTEGRVFKTLLYSGEQAFRIMNDEYRAVLPYLSCLENYAKVNDKDQYDLYKNFINFLKEKGFETDDDLDRLVSYIDILENSHQEISDVYVPDNFLETTVDETLLEEFVR